MPPSTVRRRPSARRAVPHRCGPRGPGDTWCLLGTRDEHEQHVWLSEQGPGAAPARQLPMRHPRRLSWAPPPLRTRSVTAFGGALIREVSTAVNQPRKQMLAGAWSTWAVGLVFCTPGIPDGSQTYSLPDGQSITVPRYRRLTFKSHRLSRGVDLVADGPVPVCVRNEAGWTLSATSTPAPEAMPE